MATKTKKASKRGKTGDFERKPTAKKGKANAESPAAEAQEPKGPTIGQRTKEMILEGMSTPDILKQLFEEFENCKSTPACVSWYRTRLRESGELPPVERLSAEQRKANKKATDAAWRERQKAEAKARREAAEGKAADKPKRAPKTTRKVKATA